MARKSVVRKKRKTSTKKKQKIVRIMEHAVIPECQERSYADIEYTTSREKMVWNPKVDVQGWFPAYTLLAQSLLTQKQQHEGIPNIEAMENSCSGVGEQYISDVLHESNYEPHVALQHICMEDIPQKFIDKWKPEEMELFTEGIMNYGKNFAIIRKELLPHKRVEDFADFYYVWKRSSMAEAWRNARAIIKAEEAKMEEERSKKRTNKRPCDEIRNLTNNRIMTRSAIAAARPSAENSTGTEDDCISSTSTSGSEKDEETSSAAESTDSSKEHMKKSENELPETATLEMSPMKNEQISNNSMECPTQRHKRKLSIPRKIVRYSVRNFEKESALEIKRVPAPIIPQWKSQRKCRHVV